MNPAKFRFLAPYSSYLTRSSILRSLFRASTAGTINRPRQKRFHFHSSREVNWFRVSWKWISHLLHFSWRWSRRTNFKWRIENTIMSYNRVQIGPLSNNLVISIQFIKNFLAWFCCEDFSCNYFWNQRSGKSWKRHRQHRDLVERRRADEVERSCRHRTQLWIRHPHQAEEDEGSACFGTGEEGNRIIAEERKDERGKCVFGNNFKSKQMKLYTKHRTGSYLC